MIKKISIMAVLFCVFLLGCNKTQKYNDPISYYYPNSQISFEHGDGFISSETREGSGSSLNAVITSLLKGPLDSTHENPFPENVDLIHCQLQDDSILLTLSDSYAKLSGVRLSVANACIAKTLIEYSGVNTIVIACESNSLDGENQIIITASDLLLFDHSKGSNPTSTPTLPES